MEVKIHAFLVQTTTLHIGIQEADVKSVISAIKSIYHGPDFLVIP